jgi:two-component system OmpR family sensor kinase
VSLRARILVTVVLVATLGLLVADVATYRYLSSFLLDRVDAQLASAVDPSAHLLNEPQFGGGGPDPDGDNALFPAGTYAAVLNADGNEVLGRFFYEDVSASKPDFPSDLPGSSAGGDTQRTLSVDSADGSTDFRVLAIPLQQQGTLAIAIPLTDVAQTLSRLFVIEAIVTMSVLAALGAASWWLVRLGLRPLEDMERTAGAIAAGDLSRRVETTDPRTEVGRLGVALNTMLTRIEEAFAERRASEERLRRFAADASHELRTPLTSVRGYAELFRRGAADDPEALANAMRRIEQESERMSDLVEELSLLARLDARRPLDLDDVDLAEIATAAVDAARVAQPERRIDLEAPAALPVVADGLRIRQILDNLLSNAERHTPREAAVRVRIGADDGDAVLEVEDEGRGIPDADADRVFERFFRADPSRSRDSGGSGLGLSIVAALAEAHGGEASYARAPSGGSRFTVRLPRTGPDHGVAPLPAAPDA